MSFYGDEGSEITLSEASALTSNYRSNNSGATLGHFIGKDNIENLLGQTGCVGIRIYYGEDESGNKKIILVGADENEDDMLDLMYDHTKPCPSRCGSSNSLNSNS